MLESQYRRQRKLNLKIDPLCHMLNELYVIKCYRIICNNMEKAVSVDS